MYYYLVIYSAKSKLELRFSIYNEETSCSASIPSPDFAGGSNIRVALRWMYPCRRPTTEVVYQTLSPPNTIAVIVNISLAGGAIKIGEKSDNNLGVSAVES